MQTRDDYLEKAEGFRGLARAYRLMQSDRAEKYEIAAGVYEGLATASHNGNSKSNGYGRLIEGDS